MNWPEQINQVVCADVLDYLREIPDAVVQTCITSPPFWGLRDYGTATWEGGDAECDHQPPDEAGETNKPTAGQRQHAGRFSGPTCYKCGAVRIDKQLGLEATPELFVEKMVEVFREVRRVLRDDGCIWVNLGDSYAKEGMSGLSLHGETSTTGKPNPQAPIKKIIPPGLKPKDLCMIPARVAMALRADGWYLRSDIIWHKKNPMPESVTDRPTKSHEYLFLLSKSQKYYYDADAIREPNITVGDSREDRGRHTYKGKCDGTTGTQQAAVTINSLGRNKRTVWTIATEPCPHAHFATFPTKLVEPCILAGSSEKGQCPKCGKPWVRETETNLVPTKKAAKTFVIDKRDFTADNNDQGSNRQKDGHKSGYINRVTTLGWRPGCECSGEPVPQIVLDPFCGKGTTAKRAKELGREYLTCDLNEEYCALARMELAQRELFSVRRGS